MKNVLLVHGYNGIPKIYTYFKEELEKAGYNVMIPEFPTKTEITIDRYYNVLEKYKEYFNDDLILIAHSIGNEMVIKYICKNNLNIGLYISLAGFAKPFIVENREDLNNVIAPIKINYEEQIKCTNLIKNRYSIYSDNDHIVPYKILEEYCEVIASKPMLIKGIGHLGKKSGLEKLPEVIDIIKQVDKKKNA